MDVNKFEEQYGLEKGEITRVLKKKYPAFNKVVLSYARRSRDTGVQLTPSATKYLKSIYEPPKEKVKTNTTSVRISKDLYNQLKEKDISLESLIQDAIAKE